MAKQAQHILLAGLHFLLSPKPLASPFNKERGNLLLYCPAIQAIFGSGSYPIGHIQPLSGLTGGPAHFFFPFPREKDQWLQTLIAIAAVKIGQKIRSRIKSLLQSPGQTEGGAALGRAGESPVQIDLIFRHHLFGPGIKALRIGQGQQKNAALHLSRLQLFDQTAKCFYPHIFTPMNTGGDHQPGAGRRSTQTHPPQHFASGHRDLHPFFLPGRNILFPNSHTSKLLWLVCANQRIAHFPHKSKGNGAFSRSPVIFPVFLPGRCP